MNKTRIVIVFSVAVAIATIRVASAAGTTEEMAEGEIIVQDLLAHDKTILTRWTTERSPGTVTINVYGVTDATKQDTIISWVKALKRRGDVSLRVNVRFYKSVNLIRISDDPILGWRHGPEQLVRSERI